MYLVDPELIAAARNHDLPAPRTVLDLSVDEEHAFSIGDVAYSLKVLGIEDRRDSVQGALSDSRVRLVLNGDREFWLTCGTYNLPLAVDGIRIDCLATSSYVKDNDHNKWGIANDVLLRIWPEEGPLLAGGCQYPLLGEWLHSQTQVASETLYVNGYVPKQGFYYHAPIDIGAFAGEPVIAVCSGIIVAFGADILPGCEGLVEEARDDAIMVIDGRGWIHKYAHLDAFVPHLAPGMKVVLGEQLGEVGVAGSSGGWSHLHYKVLAKMPSGKWGNEDMYAYLLDAWTRDNDVELIACARPHRTVAVGERVILSAKNTWSSAEADLDFYWTMPDGSPAFGREVIWTATNPGTYTATVHVEDGCGNNDRDNALIQVVDKGTDTLTIHAALWPCNRVSIGEEVELAIRSFNNPENSGEQVDFGDTSDPIWVKSDGNAEPNNPNGYAIAKHTYANAGKYLIQVNCQRADGQTASVNLTVVVE